MKVIYGSANKDKVKQVTSFFDAKGIDIDIISLKDIGFDKEIIEDGKTFEENSKIKAKEIKEFCDLNNINEIIVTDDSGLCVDCLNGEPGVLSARYAGEHATQEQILTKLLKNMEGVQDDKRTARFECVLTAVLKNGKFIQMKGITDGKIVKEITKWGGLTYCPVFIPEGFNKVLADFEPEELETTHREKAFLKLIEIFENIDEK